MSITRDLILDLISSEKEQFSKYSQLCATYQIQIDQKAQAMSQGKLDILNYLLKVSGQKI